MTQLNAAKTTGGVLLGFGVLMFGMSIQIPPTSEGGTGARVFPVIATLYIALLGALEILRGLGGDTRPLIISDHGASVLGLLALALVYVMAITQLGYLIATGVAAPFAMFLFGIRRPLGLLLAAILCPVIFHLIFFVGLGVYPPYGNWFDLLDVLQGN